MAGLETDTSSYLKPSLPVSPLDTVAKLGTIQQQKLGIDQAKLDQANQGLTYLARAMTALGPNATKDQYKAAGENVTRQLGLNPDQTKVWDEQVDAAPDSPTFFKRAMSQIGTHQEILNLHTGVNSNATDSQSNIQGKTDVMSGGFTPATTIPIQPPPTQPTVNNQPILPNGQPNPNYLQPQIVGASAPPGVYPARPGALPVAPLNNAPAAPVASPAPMPVARPSLPTTGPTGPTVQTGHDFNQRFAGGPIATGAPPGVASAIQAVGEQSGKDYATDLTRAKNYQVDLQPDLAVLDIVKGKGPADFGPGTDALNQAKKLAGTWLPNIDPKVLNEATDYDTVKKYLVQGARVSGNTGSNDQLAAAFEANPNTTMSTATIENIVKSRVALRKMQHAQTLLFGQQNLPDSEYSKWISKNQNVLDPRAFGFDMMTPEARSKFMSTIATQDKAGDWIAKKDKKKEFAKFEQSLSFANDAGLIEPPGRK